MDKVLTREEVRSELQTRGLSVAEWARVNGFNRIQVYAVLSGRTKGLRGASHDIAVALNLKSDPDYSERFQCLDLTRSQN